MSNRTTDPMTMRQALEHCYKVFHSMADRGAYPQELLPYELGENRPSPLFMGVQGIGFIQDALRDALEPAPAVATERMSDIDLECLLESYARNPSLLFCDVVVRCLRELQSLRLALEPAADSARLDWLERQILCGRFEIAQSLYRSGFEFGWHRKNGVFAEVSAGTLREAIDKQRTALTKEEKHGN